MFKKLKYTCLLLLLPLATGCGGSDGGGNNNTATFDQAIVGDFIFPFRHGQTWMICQGYNTPGITHTSVLTHSLDFSVDLDAASTSSGCAFSTANASAGQAVYAPAAGTIAAIAIPLPLEIAGMACLNLDAQADIGANSVLLGHFDLASLQVGDAVQQGQVLGTLTAPSPLANGSYSHIHISAHEGSGCSGSSIPLNDVFGGGYNFTADGSEQQWRGTAVHRGEAQN